MPTATPGLLLLADSRLPAGAHAHSAGVEAAVDRGLVRDEIDLGLLVAARVRAGGPVAAGAAAAALLPPDAAWGHWDAALSARTPAAALREASRAQGAALLRTARRTWPAPALDALARLGRPHAPLVLGAALAAADPGDADPVAAALLALHGVVGAACSAAVRLLGLDPLAVAGVQAAALRDAVPVARDAADAGSAAARAGDPALLPTGGTPLPEVLAQLHARSEVTLFAS